MTGQMIYSYCYLGGAEKDRCLQAEHLYIHTITHILYIIYISLKKNINMIICQ